MPASAQTRPCAEDVGSRLLTWRRQLIDQHIHLSFELRQDARKSAHGRAGADHVTHSEGFLRPLCLINQHLRVGDEVVQSIYLVGHGVSLLTPSTR